MRLMVFLVLQPQTVAVLGAIQAKVKYTLSCILAGTTELGIGELKIVK